MTQLYPQISKSGQNVIVISGKVIKIIKLLVQLQLWPCDKKSMIMKIGAMTISRLDTHENIK